jgi:flagellar hook-associated protein 2
MGRIQANTGLVTGIDIQGTVDKLMALEAKPRDTATARLTAVKGQQTAVADVTASVIAVQLAAKGLSKADAFAKTTLTSSNTAVLTALASPNGPPAAGNYVFTALRLAQAQHALSQGLTSSSTPLGAGTFTLRDGGAMNEGIALSALNGGSGVPGGKIRITDRSGATAVIDLRYAQTIDDVLQAINTNESINVTASTSGDRIVLSDNTGQSTTNLRVQEVGTGGTAAALGLSSINAAASSVSGLDVLNLSSSTALAKLNDGSGIDFNSALPDLRVTFRDGSSPLDIDFRAVAKAASQASGSTSAASGINADLKFTAVQTGGDYDGVQVKFVDSGANAHGAETASYNANSKTLTLDISASTTADDVIATVARTPAVAALFTAARGTGSNGSGVVSLTDTATLSGGAATAAGNETTVGDLLKTLNAADPTRLKAQISADGDRIELVDLTTGGGTFAAASLNGGSVAEELGLAQTTAGGTIAGRRLQGGLSTTLLHSLNGGQGFGTLGQITLTDRSGASASVDLSSAETVDDVLKAINSAGLGLRAKYNSAGNGIQIVDTTGSTTSALIVANADGTNTATKLKLAGSVSASSLNSGDLSRQVVSRQTLLADFNHGQGVRLGSLTIVDSSGVTRGLNLKTLNAKTIGDVLDAINGLGFGVSAKINDTGDGIALIDTAGGSGKLKVQDVGSGLAATDLKIAGEAVAGKIDGSTTVKITLGASDTLTDLVKKINDANTGLGASIFNDGSSSPYHLSLLNGKTGSKAGWLIDGSGLNLNLSEITHAQDALVSVGPDTGGGSNLVVSSATNTVDDAVAGVRLNLNSASSSPVTVTVTQDVASISAKVKSFVDSYNKLQDKLDKYDFYNSDGDQRGTLYGSSETLRVKSDLSRLLSGRFTGSNIKSLESLGVSFDDKGRLQYDDGKFQSAYNANPSGVQTFFTDATTGFSKKIDDTVERLAGEKNSVLINRTIALQAQSEQLSSRIDSLTQELDKTKQRLLLQFYNLETSVSKIQNSFGSIQSSLESAVALSKSN